MEHPRARCDGCGGNLEPWEQGPIIFDCFHALHAACATSGSDACPLCRSAGEEVEDPLCRSAGEEVEDPPPATRCDVCGDLFNPAGTGFEGDKCMECNLRGLGRAPGSPTWSFGSPARSPSPYYYDVDEFEQPKPPTAIPAARSPSPYYYDVDELEQQKWPPTAIPTAPSQYGGTVPPFAQPPPAPANPFHFQPPAQFAPPPSVFQQYPQPELFRPPPYFYGPPLPPPQQQHYNFQKSTFEYQQQPPLAPPRFAYAPPATVPPYCAACGGAVVRGQQTAVTSQCNHTFHFRCFAGGAYACPACGARWSDVGPAIQPPSCRY